MPTKFAIIGAPSSAGAHMPGQEKAPAALRGAGLLDHLRKSAGDVLDRGDLPIVRHTPDRSNRHRQNADRVLEVAETLADRVEEVVADGHLPLVLGGDCTISLGVISGYLRSEDDLGLIYFDAHGDLNTPRSSSSGALDSMGMAHLLGDSDAVERIARMGPRFPLMSDQQVIFYGYVPEELNPIERQTFDRRRLRGYPADDVAADPSGAAATALSEIESRSRRFLVHFDVDALDFVDCPLANIPTINRGVRLADALASLSVFRRSPRFGGLVISEINPNHADEGGKVLRDFAAGLAEALS